MCCSLNRVKDFQRFDHQQLLKGVLACRELKVFWLGVTSPSISDAKYSQVVAFSEALLTTESQIEKLTYVYFAQVSFNYFL